ncbi:hypothetical protein [Lysinibacillus capsici]|uniref:hypothetical protein n=1 Tax=Lysinibacillus capsici TaxID=2115968 RepID=UPI002E249327|nr:hypothetical protein [Lysinibacillus capsici]
MKHDAISFNKFINYSPDDEIWKPINNTEDKVAFEKLIQNVEYTKKHGTKKEKGDSLEELMDFIYNRFDFVKEVIHNRSTSDNQIDHIVIFLDYSMPKFIFDKTRGTLIGESKNHNKSIGTREVSNLNQLLKVKDSDLGIFSAYNSFSRGKNMWCASEGVRRKLFLSDKKIIIGFNFEELKSLSHNNFYTLIQQKYNNLVDEIEDSFSDNGKVPYHEYLHETILNMKKLGLMSEETYLECKLNIENRYGQLLDT